MDNIFERINNWIQNVEFSLVNFISIVAPWLAPLAPAFLSFKHMREILEYPLWVSLALAGVVEMLGLSTISTTLTFWNHNRRYSADRNKVPLFIPILSFLFYLFVIMAMNVMLEANPSPGTIVIVNALLTLLTIPAALTLAVRTMHQEMITGLKRPSTKGRSKSVQKVFKMNTRSQGTKGWKKQKTIETLDTIYAIDMTIPSVRNLQSYLEQEGVSISVGTAKNSLDEWKTLNGIE
jgi:hypothetical protein